MTTNQEAIIGDHSATTYTGMGTGLTDVPRAGIAAGTVNHVVINNGSGALASEAQLATTRGGTGIDSSALTGVAKITAGVWSAGTIDQSNIDPAAEISRANIAAGSADHVVINDGAGDLSSETQLAVSRGGTGQDFSGIGAGPFIVTVSSGVMAATLQYSQNADPLTLVQRDAFGNIDISSISITTISSPGDLTFNVGGDNIYLGDVATHITPTTIAGGDTADYAANVSTSGLTPATLFTLPTAIGAGSATTYTIRGLVTVGETAAPFGSGGFSFHVTGKNVGGVATVGVLVQYAATLDLSLTGALITADVSGTNIRIRVTGILATILNWCGRFTVVSQEY